MRVMRDPAEHALTLKAHFRSPLALKHHVQSVITAIKYMGKLIPAQSLEVWRQVLCDATSTCSLLQKAVESAFLVASEASPDTLAGYANHIMNMSALLNVENFMDILVNPSMYWIELHRSCTSPYTESTYITTLLPVFKYNPEVQERYPAAYVAWSRACAEHRARHLKAARQNAPVSTRQSENYVPMSKWCARLVELKQVPDPHDTLQHSMTLLFLTYACCIPPKRADVGTLHIFDTAPSRQHLDAWPNHIIVDQACMRITKHKTSKHEAHRAGISEELPQEFMQALRLSLESHPRQHLFVDAKGQAYTTKGFSKWVRRTTARLFGDKAPGINLLRHSFCTSLDYNQLNCAERDSIALRCGHSSTMQDQYRCLSLEPVRKDV